MKRLLIQLLTISAIASLGATAATTAGGWNNNYQKAATQAKAEHKLLLLDFTGSDWCPWCIQLNKEVFSQPEFKDYAARNLVLMEVDFPQFKEQPGALKAQNEKLQEKYQIEEFPTVLVLNSEGKKVGTLGYQPGGPKAFIAALKQLKK